MAGPPRQSKAPSGVGTNLIPFLVEIADQPVERMVAFEDNARIQFGWRILVVHARFDDSPVIAIDQISLIENLRQSYMLLFYLFVQE